MNEKIALYFYFTSGQNFFIFNSLVDNLSALSFFQQRFFYTNWNLTKLYALSVQKIYKWFESQKKIREKSSKQLSLLNDLMYDCFIHKKKTFRHINDTRQGFSPT